MSVALLSAVDPYPVDAGKKVVLAGFVDYFRERFGPDRVHYLLVGGTPQPNFPVTLRPLPRPRPAAALLGASTRVPTGRASLQESMLRSRRIGDAIAEALDRVDPALEVYDTIRMAQYAAPGRADRQICYLDDLFSERYRAMLAATDRHPDVELRPLGNFAAHVPAPLRPLADARHAQRALLRLEARAVERSEDRAARAFGRSLLVNGGEAERLAARSGAGDVVQAVPPLVSVPHRPRSGYAGDPVFAFLGLLSLPHNDDGLRSFLAETWPLVLAAAPGARLEVYGREPSGALSALVDRFADSVRLRGWVADLDGELDAVAALVNPLRFGSGVKLKVIEALARGLPVASTTTGADGFDCAEGGIVVADGSADFAAAMLDLTGPAHNRAVSAGARDHYLSRFSRAAVFTRYDAAFDLG